MRRPWVAGAVFLVVALSTHAARISTDIRAPDSLTVGDRFQLTVNVIAPQGAEVSPPREDLFGEITVKEWNTTRKETGDADSVVFSYLLTTYVPKPCTIPALPFVVTIGAHAETLHTEQVPLQVHSVLPADTVDIRDIKPPFSAGRPSLWWLWTILGLAAASGVAYAGYRWYRFRTQHRPEPPPPPPYDEAIEALRELEVRNLVRQGRVQEYVFRLSEILKRYLERRFEFNAEEFTTEEILAWLRASSLSRSARASAEWFLRESDPVKFARFLPDDATLQQMLREVRSFVEETKPLPPTPPGTAADAGGEEKTGGA